MEPLLDVRKIEAGYDGRPVLHQVSLSLAPGEIVALVGPNGAGKSTLLKAIFGLVRTTHGEIVYHGQQIRNREPSRNARDGLSYLVQGSRVFAELSVEENLEVGGYMLSAQDMRRRMEDALGFFPELRGLRRRNAGTLGTGEKQVVALARALMLRPAVILADEPSLGLGPKLTRAALDRLHRLSMEHGTAILLVEQNVREALAVAQRVYALRLGQVVLVDKPGNLTVESLRQAFLG